MSSRPRITADFNYGGRDGDYGVVYLGPDTLQQLERHAIELTEGMELTLSDFNGTPEEPTWLVVTGVVRIDEAAGRWKLVYAWNECRWELRESNPRRPRTSPSPPAHPSAPAPEN